MSTIEERSETGLGASEKDYDEIFATLKAKRWELANKFENLVADVANECYDRAAGEALGGAVIDGTIVFGDEAISRREVRFVIPPASARATYKPTWRRHDGTREQLLADVEEAGGRDLYLRVDDALNEAHIQGIRVDQIRSGEVPA